jgi:hypothetical protein
MIFILLENGLLCSMLIQVWVPDGYPSPTWGWVWGRTYTHGRVWIYPWVWVCLRGCGFVMGKPGGFVPIARPIYTYLVLYFPSFLPLLL